MPARQGATRCMGRTATGGRGWGGARPGWQSGRGSSMRAKVCSMAEDHGLLTQAIIGGRAFFGMVREVQRLPPAPLSELRL
jgi:hypothetical protein